MRSTRRQFMGAVAALAAAVAIPFTWIREKKRRVFALLSQRQLDAIPDHMPMSVSRRSPDTPEKRAARDAFFSQPTPPMRDWPIPRGDRIPPPHRQRYGLTATDTDMPWREAAEKYDNRRGAVLHDDPRERDT